jgi:predicted HTH transcriptional regulator
MELMKYPSITSEMLSAETGIVDRNIRTNIVKLRKAGLVDHIGSDTNYD